MATQVYAVVHDGNGNFLLGIKNARGYFFHNANAPGGVVIPQGQPLNGGGSYALPGGGLPGGQQPATGAATEFLEETNIQLANYHPALQPAAYHGVQNPHLDYWGVFFQIAPNDFQNVAAAASGNLDAGSDAANAVIAGTYGAGQYDALIAAFPGCPADNELDSIHEWNINANWADIQAWQNSPTLGWFYNILAYWHQHP